jgi:O-antigen/teichoic acid export membrane protein
MVLLTEHTRDWERGARASVFAGIRRFSLGAAGIAALVCAPVLVFMPDLLRLAYGPEFVRATDAARIIVPAAALQFVFGWTKPFPVSIGRPNLRVLAHGIETVVLLPLVAVLGLRWGATGAAIGVLASTIVFVVVWTALFFRLRRTEVTGTGVPLEALVR